MANINISYTDIRSAAARLTAGREDISGRLNDLRRLVSELVSSGFVTDQASGRFNDSAEKFHTGVQRALSGLDELARFLNDTASTLEDIDRQIAARLN